MILLHLLMTTVDVHIEISKNSCIKYEIDHETKRLVCDRILHGPFKYLFNYGYIPNTLSPDGDALDAVVLCEHSLHPTCYVKCKIIGALITEDEKGIDNKLILVPDDTIDKESTRVNNISNVTESTLDTIKYFFERYKDLEPNKFVNVKEFVNAETAVKIYNECVELYVKCKKLQYNHQMGLQTCSTLSIDDPELYQTIMNSSITDLRDLLEVQHVEKTSESL